MTADKVLTMSGGAARSELWSSLIGYICDNDMMLTVETDTPALGAAMIAAVNAGAFTDYTECAGAFVIKKPLILNKQELKNFYSEKFNRYCSRFII
jgi:ribulose kinase